MEEGGLGMRTDYLLPVLLVVTAVVAGACTGGLPGFSAQVPCPPAVETPVLYPGDTWTFRFDDGQRWRHTLDAVTEDGLLRGHGPEPNVEYYYDHAHTLRKVYVDGTWITGETRAFPEIGKTELEFPLEVGKVWTTRWHTDGAIQINQGSHVLGCEEVTVPAGTFVAVRIWVSRTDNRSRIPRSRDYTLWYAPVVKYWVKGTGTFATIADRVAEFELESFAIDAAKAAPR